MSLSKAKEYAKKKGITLKDDDNKKAVTKRSQSSSVSKQERNIGDVHLTGYHIFLGSQQLSEMNVIHHTDLIVLLKYPA